MQRAKCIMLRDPLHMLSACQCRMRSLVITNLLYLFHNLSTMFETFLNPSNLCVCYFEMSVKLSGKHLNDRNLNVSKDIWNFKVFSST